jgi:hypothetical protein
MAKCGCVNARCEDASKSHDVESMRSSSCGVWTLESLVWDETHVTLWTEEGILISDPPDVAMQGCLDVVAMAGGSWGCGS